MDDQGWFSVSRRLLHHDLWLTEPFTRGQAWVDMIGLTNHKDGFLRVRGILRPVLRGQLGWSEARLAERWQWSRTKVRAFLGELETSEQIKQQKDNQISIITILKYELYQGKRPQKDTNNKAYTQPYGREPQRPSIDDVMFHAQRIGLVMWKAEDWFNEMEGCGWLDYNHRPIVEWKAVLNRVRTKWEADGRPMKLEAKNNGTNKQFSRPGTDRNAGTANEGRAADYKRSV